MPVLYLRSVMLFNPLVTLRSVVVGNSEGSEQRTHGVHPSLITHRACISSVRMRAHKRVVSCHQASWIWSRSRRTAPLELRIPPAGRPIDIYRMHPGCLLGAFDNELIGRPVDIAGVVSRRLARLQGSTSPPPATPVPAAA